MTHGFFDGGPSDITLYTSKAAYFAENDWYYIHSLSLDDSKSVPLAQAVIAALAPLKDAGISIYICWDNAFYSTLINGVPAASATVSDYEHDFGAVMDLFEAEGSYIVGYTTETDHLAAIQWLDEQKASTRKIHFHWYPMVTAATMPTPRTDFIPYLDEVVFELYVISDMDTTTTQGAAEVLTYFKDHTSIPYGIITNVWDDPYTLLHPEAFEHAWWNDGDPTQYTVWSLMNQAQLPLEEQRKRMAVYLNELKDELGPLPLVETMHPYHWFSEIQTDVRQTCDYLKSLNLDGIGTRKVDSSSSTGTTLYYRGASRCKYSATAPHFPVDTFVNTGRELLFLKSTGPGCRLHDITVTGFDRGGRTTEKAYNELLLTADYGRPIGPFPINKFGALPQIIYDSTDLDVTVLKVTPYSQQA
jgi:hypothetical protein